MLRIFREVGIVMAIALVLAAGAYLLRPQTLPLWASRSVAVSDEPVDTVFKPITIEDAIELFEHQSVLFADARSQQAYEAGHIQGAIQLDPYGIDTWSDRVIAHYPPDQILITYCDGVRCTLARTLAEKLTWLGFEQVYYLDDGWAQWKAKGQPVSVSAP